MNGQRNHGVGPQPAVVSNAALRGASLAFSKPPVAPKPQVNTYTGGSNGALLAAAKVGAGQRGSVAGSPAPLANQVTGGSVRSDGRPNLSPLQAGSKSSSSSTLGVPEDPLDRIPSPSNIAARLAAARFSPMPPKQPASNAPAIMNEHTTNERDILPPTGSVGSVLARLQSNEPPRLSSYVGRQPSTTRPAGNALKSTIGGYDEMNRTPTPSSASSARNSGQKRHTPPSRINLGPRTAQASPPPLQSPKPQRMVRLSTDLEGHPLPQNNTAPVSAPVQQRPMSGQRISLPPSQCLDSAESTGQNLKVQKGPMKSPPIKQKPIRLSSLHTGDSPLSKPPLPRTSSQHVRLSSDDIRHTAPMRRVSTSIGSEPDPSSPSSFKSAKEVQDDIEKARPSVPPPRRSTAKKVDTSQAADKSRTPAPLPIAPRKQGVPSSPARLPEKFSPPRRPASAREASPASVYHNAYQRDSVKQITQHMTGESLSSAIMGAALASSRNASPAPAQSSGLEPLFPPRKHHHHHSPFHRSPSPQKQSPPKSSGKLRTTMRKDPSSSDDEDDSHDYKKKGSRFMGMKGRKHPNKHHEGTRKRWRDQITERERKRYEGVWAANKGILVMVPQSARTSAPSDDDPSHDVLNLVVQEIWRRSRLPEHVLEEVWDLVDSRAVGRLRREEFVVGLWLVDQRLKGRKLPPKVSESVWMSARGLGLKVKVRR